MMPQVVQSAPATGSEVSGALDGADLLAVGAFPPQAAKLRQSRPVRHKVPMVRFQWFMVCFLLYPADRSAHILQAQVGEHILVGLC